MFNDIVISEEEPLGPRMFTNFLISEEVPLECLLISEVPMFSFN